MESWAQAYNELLARKELTPDEARHLQKKFYELFAKSIESPDSVLFDKEQQRFWTSPDLKMAVEQFHIKNGLIPARVKADSFWGFRSGASQIPWWRAGGSPCGQGLRFAQTMMRPGFED